ncbi:MAG TPA: mechanosensitive ion channel domain-containing protein, partial [Erysipelothrix sp.]|nr:mechanosensitive ion channel domain-containing protein [Erysipelothrix sp.]
MNLKDIFNQTIILKKLITTTIVISVAYTSNKYLSKTLNKTIQTKGKTHKRQTIIYVLNSIIKFFIYFIASMIVLETFGVSTSSIVTIAGVGSVALGLGAQTLVKDVVNGLFILAENQYNVGDYVEIADYSGTVESLSLRTTILRTVDGELCIVPNGDIRGV